MSIFDAFRVGKIKSELAAAQMARDELKKQLESLGGMDLLQVREQIRQEQLRVGAIRGEVKGIEEALLARKAELVELDEKVLLQSFGLYKPKYNLTNSAAYQVRVEAIRERQSTMVKLGQAAKCPTNWSVNNSQKEGERMIRDYTKLIIRAFNNECDTAIGGAKFNNIDSVEKRIKKAFETLNKLGARMSIEIQVEYLGLKLEELYVAYEYEVKKKEEKEEQKRVREQMREEARVMREIEEQRSALNKEEKHFEKAIKTLDARLEQATTDTERAVLEEEKALVAEKLAEVQKNKAEVDYREQNTRAGYVYIISNVGAFGEGTFKIGVTRRLDPIERIDELSDASVPYDFDVHAIVFSDDAPALEAALHREFTPERLNLVNLRREFFRATLDEIERVLKENFKKPVELTRIAEAAEYRQSERLRLERRAALT